MVRNFGLGKRQDYRTVRPKGCECQTWFQAEGCYEACHLSVGEPAPQRVMTGPVLMCVLSLIAVTLAIVFWPTPAKQCPPYYECNGSAATNNPRCCKD